MGYSSTYILEAGIPGGGTSGDFINAVAGETLSVNDCVFLAPNNSSGGTPGRAYKTDASVANRSNSSFLMGFVTVGASTGGACVIRAAGVAEGFSGLTSGAPYYVSMTPGGITSTSPSNSVLVGIAVNATQILINVRGRQGTVSPVMFGGLRGYVVGNRITFSNDTTSAATSVTLNRSSVGTTAQKDVKGYFCGGAGAIYYATTDKLTFSTEAMAAQASADLSAYRFGQAGVSQSSTKGFIGGGQSGSGTRSWHWTAVTDRITYSTDTSSYVSGANLTLSKSYYSSISEGTSKGYFSGGGNFDGVYVLTDMLSYSTETTAAQTTASLSANRTNLAGISNGYTKGYASGGSNTTYMVNTDKITFSTDVATAQTSANLLTGVHSHAGVSEGNSKGYFLGGTTGTSGGYPVVVATAYKATFSTDSMAYQTSANLVAANYFISGLSDIGY